MRFRLTYCNRSGNIARLDIITLGSAAVTETIEGTESPFILTYNNDKPNKSGYFRSSSADINIYETPNFNIDTLKTSNETDIKVEWYIDDVLMWAGFVIPDFFSRTIGTPATVNMTASDRLGTLKGVTLSGLSETVTLRSLATQCLQNTGLSLPLNTYAAFTSVDALENIFDSKVYSQRLNDNKGRSISCYDVLESILVLTNSILIQRFGEWYIYNKIQLESGVGLPEFEFDEVSRGAIRSIQPVASTVGVYSEFGGGRIYPKNYSFESGLDNWSIVGGFIATTENKHILGFIPDGLGVYRPYYDLADSGRYLVNENAFDAAKYLNSAYATIPYEKGGQVEVLVDINYIIPSMAAFTSPNTPTFFYYSIIARNGADYFSIDNTGILVPFSKGVYKFKPTGAVAILNFAEVQNLRNTFKISADKLSDYEISLRVYGGEARAVTIVNSFSFEFKFSLDLPKGNIYKVEQGINFTKQQDIDTTIYGDFITSGLNGYFYDYQIDDTSIIYDTSNNKTVAWTTPTDADQLPILQHVARQKSRLFSIAHDILRAELDIITFDPLTIFTDCSGKKYTLISGTYNFLTGQANVEIEEIKQDPTILKRDFIFSNFGDSDNGLRSIGGVSSSGGSSSGGGMTFEQLAILNNLADWWKLDDDGNLYSEKNVYSEKEVSAYGFSGSGTPIDGVVNLVDLWDVKPITGLTAGDILKYNGTKWVNTPESGGGGVSSWNDLTDKPTTFTPSAHNHAANDITSGIFAIGRIPTGSTGTTVALGNHLHTGVYPAFYDARILNGQTAFDWGNHAGVYDPIQIGQTFNLDTEFRLGQGWFYNLSVAGVGMSGIFHNSVTFGGNYNGVDNWLTQKIYTPDGEMYFRQKTNSEPFTAWRKVWNDKNFTNLNQLTVRNFSDLQNKPTTLLGYGIASSDTLFDARFEPKNTNIQSHIYNTSNPHSVTKAQVELGNVTNESKATMFSNPSFTGTATVQTDIILSNLLSTNKSLKTLLDKFDIDVYGNLIIKTNLYSLGEVTAYKSGGGVSGLKLQGDLDADGKNINNVPSISNSYSIAFDIQENNQLTIADDGIYANANIEGISFYASVAVDSPVFKVGDYTIKQEGTDLIFYNGTTKVMKLSAGGNLSLKGTLTQNATL